MTYQPPVMDDRLDPWGRSEYYGPPGAPWPPPAPMPMPPKPGKPWAPGVTVGLVVAAVVGASIFTGRPASSMSPIEQWLPTDGHRVLFTYSETSDGKFAEWSRPDVYTLLQSDLPAYFQWFGKTGPGPTTKFLRLHAIQADATGDSTGLMDRLWTVEPDGLRAAIDVDLGGGLTAADLRVEVLVPGRLDMPAGVTAGDQWTSSGTVWTWNSEAGSFDESSYSASSKAAPAADTALPDGCLDVSMDQQVQGASRSELTTWCPGLGIVAFDDGTHVWKASDNIPPANVGTEDVFDWGTADSLDFSPLAVNQGGNSLTLSPAAPPGLLQGGAIFAGKIQPDLLAVSTTGESPSVVWATRPGGTPTTAATLDGITMVATTQRMLVAYNSQGRWLWETPLPDMSVVQPILFDDRVVVVTLDGSVLALDPTTGASDWTADVGAEVWSPPVASGGRLLVANQAGVLTCLDGAGRTDWAKEVGVPAAMAISPGPDPVVVYAEQGSATLVAYALYDGNQVWRSRVFQFAKQLITLDSVLVLRDNGVLLGIDWRTGQVLWQWSRQATAVGIGGGERVLLLTNSELVLLSADGSEVKTWPHQLGHVTGSSPYLVATQGAVLVYGSNGAALGVTP